MDGVEDVSSECNSMKYYECVTGVQVDLRSYNVMQPLLLEKRKHLANAITRRLSCPALITCMECYILRHLCTSYNSMPREKQEWCLLVEHSRNAKYIYLHISLHVGLSVIESSAVDHEIGFYRANEHSTRTNCNWMLFNGRIQ